MIGFNVWSGTDYRGAVVSEQTETSYFNAGGDPTDVESSNDWSQIGNKSFKQTYEYGGYSEFVLRSIDVTKTYVAKLDVLTGISGSLILVSKNTENNDTSFQSVNFNASDSVQHLSVTITGTDLEGKNELRMRLRNTAEGTIYSDNWELFES